MALAGGVLVLVSIATAYAIERELTRHRQRQERFFAVFERSPIIIGLLTVPDGRLVEFNVAGTNAFGYTRDEALGKTSTELRLWADPADRDRYLRELVTNGSCPGTKRGCAAKMAKSSRSSTAAA